MEHCVANTGIAFGGVQFSGVAPSDVAYKKLRVPLIDARSRFPDLESRFIKPDEDAFTVHLSGGHPFGCVLAQIGHRWSFIWIRSFFRRFDPRESKQRIHLTEPF